MSSARELRPKVGDSEKIGRHLPPGGRIVEAREATAPEAPEPEPVPEPATTVEDPLGASPGPDLRNGLVHHWRFDETKGDTARDSVGKLNATLVNYGPADKRWAKGKIGNAILFSKPQQGAFLTKDIDFPQLTIAVWLNVIQESGINPHIAFPWVTLSYNQKKGVSIFSQVMEPTKPKVGEWNHYAVTIDQDTMTATIYKNGEEVASGKHEGATGESGRLATAAITITAIPCVASSTTCESTSAAQGGRGCQAGRSQDRCRSGCRPGSARLRRSQPSLLRIRWGLPPPGTYDWAWFTSGNLTKPKGTSRTMSSARIMPRW